MVFGIVMSVFFVGVGVVIGSSFLLKLSICVIIIVLISWCYLICWFGYMRVVGDMIWLIEV